MRNVFGNLIPSNMGVLRIQTPDGKVQELRMSRADRRRVIRQAKLVARKEVKGE